MQSHFTNTSISTFTRRAHHDNTQGNQKTHIHLALLYPRSKCIQNVSISTSITHAHPLTCPTPPHHTHIHPVTLTITQHNINFDNCPSVAAERWSLHEVSAILRGFAQPCVSLGFPGPLVWGRPLLSRPAPPPACPSVLPAHQHSLPCPSSSQHNNSISNNTKITATPLIIIIKKGTKKSYECNKYTNDKDNSKKKITIRFTVAKI